MRSPAEPEQRRRRGHPARDAPAPAGRHDRLEHEPAAGAAARLGRRRGLGPRGAGAAGRRTSASPPTSGRSPRGASCAATALACDEHDVPHPEDEPRAHPVRHGQAPGRPRPGRRRVGLHARGPGPDRAVRARRLRLARRRRVRLLRHPRRRPPLLPHRRAVARRADAAAAGQARRGRRPTGRPRPPGCTACTTSPPARRATRAATPEATPATGPTTRTPYDAATPAPKPGRGSRRVAR